MPPSKREILEKYRHVITHEDFELLIAEELPGPEASHQEGVTLQVLGKLNGWWVFAKRCGGVVIGVIVILGGGLIPGIEYINKYSRIAYDAVAEYVSRGTDHNCAIPATEYVVAERPPQWALQSEEPFKLVEAPAPTTTTTTTTTTTAPPEDNFSILPSGSGLVPFSSGWA